MAPLAEQHPQPWVKRVLSPDRRLALDFIPHPDPRTRFEAEGYWSTELRDAETGMLLGDFPGEPLHEWPDAGGVALRLWDTVLTVAPDLASFMTLKDGSRVFPVGELA